MKDPRFVDIFRMVDHSICSIEVDNDKPHGKSLIIRKDAAGMKFEENFSRIQPV